MGKIGKRVHKKHVVVVIDHFLHKYGNDGRVKYWIVDVGMELDGDGTTSVITDFKPENGDLLVIKQTSELSAPCYVWTKVEDE